MEYQDKFTNFDCTGDPSNIGPRWGRWLSSFEIFADSRGLILEEGKDTHKQRRRALLLHSAAGGTLRGEGKTARGELRGATSEGKTARGKLRGATCEGDKRTARARSEQRGREARSVQACSEVYPRCH